MTGSIMALMAHFVMLLAIGHSTPAVAPHAADNCDSSCVQAAAIDEEMAEVMQVQLLQTNDVPSTPKQIRLQAQEKRTKLATEEAQKWSALKREHKLAAAAQHLAEVKDRELVREAEEAAAKEEEEDEEEAEEEDDDEDDEEDEEDEGADEEDEDDESANETETTHRAHITSAKRAKDKHKALQLQADKRNRALKEREMRKRRSTSTIRHASAEHNSEQVAADKVLAVRDAAMQSATEVMAAQGVTPETIQAAEELLTHQKASLLEAPHNVSEPHNARGRLARQILSEQADQRAFARKIRMAAAGTDPKKEKEEQEKLLEEEQKKKEQELEEQEEEAARKKHEVPTPAELRSQAMHSKLKEQEAMRSTASQMRLENLAEKHIKKSKKSEHPPPLEDDFAIQKASLDVKLSPAARRNQVKRLAEAHKKAIAESIHEQ